MPLAQALDTANTGPRSPNSIETWAEAALAISIGTKKGEMRSQRSVGPTARVVSSTVMMPPMPLAMMTPVRARTSGSSGSRASAQASRAATMAKWA